MMESSTSTGSSKRAKAPGHIAQVAHCLVDGCNADLSLCREYHRRHKVCEAHSKTAKVTIGGREQRFCQQCSRFHSLVEFDDGKRSCRKRLDGHNRRRRKPQPDSMTKNSSLLFTGQQGTKLLSFSNQQIYPTAVVSSAWSNVVKTDNDMVLYSQPHINCMDSPNSLFPESSAHHNSYKAGNQFPFMQGRVIPSSNSGQKMFSSGLNEIVVDSSSDHRALSLLSSAPLAAPAVTTRGEIHHMVQQQQPPPGSIPPRPHYYNALSQYHHFAHQDFDSKPSHQDSVSANFHEMMQNAPTDGSSSSGGGSQQTLAFMWD